MIKRILFFLSLFLCSLTLVASDDSYDGTYTLEMKLSGSAYSYTYNTCFIKIYDGVGDIEFDYKMTQSSTASKNYVLTTGSGSGWVEGTAFKGTGSGVITTYEKGEQDSEFGFTFTMDGTLSTIDDGRKISGTFVFTENGEPINGTFTGKCANDDEEIDNGTRFGSLKGQVEVKTPKSNVYKPAKLGMVLPLNSHIKTAEGASARLSFNDGSMFIMPEETEVVLETPPKRPSKISLIVGKIWVNVKKMIEDGTMEIDMNQAVCGIKGTTFVCEDDGTSSTLKVIEGTVWFKSKADEKTHVKVEAGEMISATKSGLGTKTTFDIDAETAKWDKYRNTSIIDKILSSTLYIVIVLASLLLLIALILFLFIRKRRRKIRKRLKKTSIAQVNEPNLPIYQQQKTVPVAPPVNRPIIDTTPTVKPQQFCTSCGAKLKPEAKFCHSCAKPVVKK